jgi:hypothetical protein
LSRLYYMKTNIAIPQIPNPSIGRPPLSQIKIQNSKFKNYPNPSEPTRTPKNVFPMKIPGQLGKQAVNLSRLPRRSQRETGPRWLRRSLRANAGSRSRSRFLPEIASDSLRTFLCPVRIARDSRRHTFCQTAAISGHLRLSLAKSHFPATHRVNLVNKRQILELILLFVFPPCPRGRTHKNTAIRANPRQNAQSNHHAQPQPHISVLNIVCRLADSGRCQDAGRG